MKDHYDGLSEEDMENLNFLLNASPEALADWAAVVSKDDIDYAAELLQMLQLRIIDIVAVQDPKLTQANEMLSKYSLT
jgi:succinate dehydrogenase flavin-adding protein (antitoxin of CptAB toxin-antitoxin module)